MLTAAVEIDESDETKIAVDTAYRCKDAVKSIPGAKWDSSRRKWTVPLTWQSCLALRSEFGSGLTIGLNLKEWATLEAKHRDRMRHLCEVKKLDPADALPELPELAGLYDHQQVAARMIAEGKRVLILDETGAGKTRSALAGLRLAAETEDIFPMLVVAPKSVRKNWARDEIPRFFPEAEIREVVGTPSKVKKLLEPGADIYVISWGLLRKYSRHAGFGKIKLTDDEKTDKELQAIGFKSAIVDEIHRAKEPGSKQSRALWSAIEPCEYRVGLTGSPIQDTPEELWSVLRAIRPEEYPLKTGWMDRFVATITNHWGGREILGLHPINGPEFLRAFDTFSSRVTKEEALPFLPPKTYETRWVELPPKLRKAYDSMRDHMLAALDEGTVAATSPLDAAGRLTQFANASGELDDDGNYRMSLPSPKIDAFLSDLADGDFDGEQLVIFSDSRQLADLLAVEMRRKKLRVGEINGSVTGDDRQAVIDKFQAGELDYCICTRAGAEGVTLTAARTMVRICRAWSSVVHTQSEDRVHRIGSEIHESVRYVDYVTLNTIEEAQLIRLNDKKKRAQEILRDELVEMI